MWRPLIFVSVLAAALQGQPAGTGAISGIVVDHATGEAVRKAIVTVAWQETPRAWATQQTDGSGRFQVDSLPPGQYTISATKEGTGAGGWGSSPGATSKLLPLTAGERRSDLVIRLVRSALITGSVVDGDGEPLVGAEVQLLRTAYPRGTLELMPAWSARTNDRGEYRLLSPVPGRFYVSANASGNQMNRGGGDMRLTYTRQYYGGASDWKKATPTALKSGQQLKGINFRLESSRSVTVRGRVTNLPPMPEQTPPGGPMHRPINAMVYLSSQENRRGQIFLGSGINFSDGTFQMQGVAPGRYALMASAKVGEKTLWAAEQLDIQRDVEDLALTLAPAVAIRGTVTIEGEGAVPMSQITVELLSPQGRGDASNRLRATPAADGAFVFDQVPPGIWDINVRPVPKGGFLKAMHLGEQDVLTEEMEIGLKAPGALNIVVSSRGGKVAGQLAGEDAKTLRAMIVLAPEDKLRHVMSLYLVAPTQAEGHFELIGVTPGKYRLFAVETSMQPFDVRNPELLAKLADSAETIEVAEGSSVRASPKVIRTERLEEAMQQ